jgi:hypothetical protein
MSLKKALDSRSMFKRQRALPDRAGVITEASGSDMMENDMMENFMPATGAGNIPRQMGRRVKKKKPNVKLSGPQWVPE